LKVRPARWWSHAWQALVNFRRDNALDLSAGIAFYSLLSLGPLLYLVGILISRFVREHSGDHSLALDLSGFLPAEAAEALKGFLLDLPPGDGLVLLAVPALLWVATTAFSALEHAVNVAFGLARFRSIWRARLKALILMAVGGILLLADTIVGELLPHLDRIREALEIPVTATRFQEITYQVALATLRFLVFAMFYKVLPRAVVGWRAAAGGALMGVVLLQVARALFGRMLLRSPALGLLSGTLAGTVTLLLWVYTSTAIILLAAEFAAVLDGRRRTPSPENGGPAGDPARGQAPSG
jgi:membrane protein